VRLSRVHVSVQSEPEEAGWAAINPSAPCGAGTKRFGRQCGAGVVGVRCGGTKTSSPPSVATPQECSSPRPGVDRGRQGSLLEDDAAVRVQSGRARVSWALWAAKLVASDGRMNVANERPSVESDEETFMDQHGRSLHLVGADVLHEQERTTLRCVMALLGLLNRRAPRVPSGIDLFDRPRWERRGFGRLVSSAHGGHLPRSVRVPLACHSKPWE
jgi:hypothetical protein